MPAKLAVAIYGHEVVRAVDVGLENVSNGKLLAGAEGLGFQVLVTIDKRMQFQQKMSGRMIATIVLDRPNSKLESLLPLMPKLVDVLIEILPGQVQVISHP